MKTRKQWLFAILITVACLHAKSLTVNAQETIPAVGNGSLGEDGSEEVRIEPNNTPLAEEIRTTLRATGATVVRRSNARFIGAAVEFLKPIDTSTNYPPFRANMMEGLRLGRSIGTGDTAFIPIPNGSTIRPDDITVTPYNNGGRYPSAGFVFRVTNPAMDFFTLGSVSYIHESSDVSTSKRLGELGFSGNFQTNNLSITRIGVDAGLDGVLGNLDDIIYTSGPPTLRLHALFYRGIANWFEEKSPANTGDVERYLAGKQPYFVRTTYTVANLGSATGMLYVQPVPPPTPPAPVIANFSANPITVVRGNSTVLSWNIENPTSLVTLGTETVAPSGTVPAPHITISATTNVLAGERVTVEWQTTGATNTTVVGMGEMGPSGIFAVTLNQTAAYTFVVTGPGGTITKEIRIVVRPVPPPLIPNFTVAMGITPSGEVGANTPLKLQGFLENKGINLLVVTNVFVQSSVNTTTNWANWGASLGSFTVPQKLTQNVERLWTSGPADLSTTWYFRLVGNAGGVAFTTTPVSVRVVPTVVPEPISLSILGQGTSVKIQLKAPPGTYYIEDALLITGPWLRGGEAVIVTAGQVPEILYTRGDNLSRFYRAVHLP